MANLENKVVIMTQLNQIISNLKGKQEIEAVFVAGSQGVSEEKEYSDIDLGIVINQETDLRGVFQWVDHKPCDIHFFNNALLSVTLKSDSIPPNDKEGLIVSLLEKADIRFDKTGILTSFKNDLENIKKKLRVPQSKIIWFEGIINSAYITNKRYFESNNSEYHQALEVKLLGDLDLLLKGYFEFRNIPWRGERQVLKYLKTNDDKFYDVYMSCIRSASLKEKFETYSILVNLVFYGNSSLWKKDIIAPFSYQSMDTQKREDLIKYWKELNK